jgi:hypothetical protein
MLFSLVVLLSLRVGWEANMSPLGQYLDKSNHQEILALQRIKEVTFKGKKRRDSIDLFLTRVRVGTR